MLLSIRQQWHSRAETTLISRNFPGKQAPKPFSHFTHPFVVIVKDQYTYAEKQKALPRRD
jgi:hypothetical protein